MRVLLDECVNQRLRNYLPGHECESAEYAGFAGRPQERRAFGRRRVCPFRCFADGEPRLGVRAESGRAANRHHHFPLDIDRFAGPVAARTRLLGRAALDQAGRDRKDPRQPALANSTLPLRRSTPPLTLVYPEERRPLITRRCIFAETRRFSRPRLRIALSPRHYSLATASILQTAKQQSKQPFDVLVELLCCIDKHKILDLVPVTPGAPRGSSPRPPPSFAVPDIMAAPPSAGLAAAST